MVIPRASGDRTRLTGRLARSHLAAAEDTPHQERIGNRLFALVLSAFSGGRLNHRPRHYRRSPEITVENTVFPNSLLSNSIDAHTSPCYPMNSHSEAAPPG